MLSSAAYMLVGKERIYLRTNLLWQSAIPKRYRVVASPRRAIELLKEGRIAGVYKSYSEQVTSKVACKVIAVYGDVLILKH